MAMQINKVDRVVFIKKQRFVQRGWNVYLATFLFLTLGLAACAGQAAWPMSNTINVSLTVQDETGKPVPYVSIWGYIHSLPIDTSHKKRIEAEDLWRLTTRYSDSFEFVHPSYKPLHFRVPAMGDQDGTMTDLIEVKNIRGKDQQRPEAFNFGYTFMKHGYLPGKVDFTTANPSDFKATITLKRDPAKPLETQPYLQAYERIRYELSLLALRNLEMTLENHQRLETYYPKLETAAQAALQQGDKTAAARMYARMQYLPQLQIANGKVIGFDHVKPDSPRSLAALSKAYELNPKQVYILTEANIWRRQLKITPPVDTKGMQQTWDAFYDQFDIDYRETMWPRSKVAGIYGLIRKGEYAKAYQAIKEAEKFEPRAEDFGKLIDELKLTMKSKNVPVPADW